jgi:hypothetical protein
MTWRPMRWFLELSRQGKMARKNAAKKEKPGFYSRALSEAEKLVLEEARDVEGLDEEIAMLRLKLRDLIQNDPGKFDLHLKITNAIARLVGIRYNITREQKKSLREAITRVLTEVAIPLGAKIVVK